jgi:CRP/FNR family cyclic AMP-dependent transcriptional regulator
MDVHELAQVLGELRFAASLPATVVKRIANAASARQFPSGAMLFREGSLNDQLLILVRGRLALDMFVPGRGDVRIMTLGPGDIVAWSALLGQGHMTTSAVALDDVEVLAVPADELRAHCEADPAMGYQLMRQMAHALAERLLATRLQLLDLFSESAPSTDAFQGHGGSHGERS